MRFHMSDRSISLRISLTGWSENSSPGVKYNSHGTATSRSPNSYEQSSKQSSGSHIHESRFHSSNSGTYDSIARLALGVARIHIISRPYTNNPASRHQFLNANIQITRLYLKSLDLESKAASSASPTGAPAEIWEERESICEHLEVLTHLPLETLDCNGMGMIAKIREIASALIREPYNSQDLEAMDIVEGCKAYIEKFIHLLDELDTPVEIEVKVE
jgi:hypothetical protein